MAELTDESEYTCTLDDNTAERARKELNEEDKDRDGSIRAFRNLVKQQAWIRAPLGTRFLLKYLRTQKFSQLEARNRLEKFLTMREEIPEWFSKKDPQDKNIQELLNCGFCLKLPRTDKDGRVFLMSRPGYLDVKRIKKELGGVDTVFRAFTTVLDMVLMDERAQVNGVVVIVDQTDFSMAHKTQVYTMDNLKRMISALQNSYPFRIKQINFYNSTTIFEAVFTIVRGLMKPKLKERIIVHGKNMVSLYNTFDMSVLPEEYLPDDYTGPNSGSVQSIIDGMRENLAKPDVKDFIQSLSTYGVDMKQKPKNDAPVASFRKLNVD